MKKIKYLIAFLLLIITSLVNANPVFVNKAQTAAANFYASNYLVASPSLSLAYTERDAGGVPVYYVFNVNTNKGFVIVTAEDAAHPIIGYSDKGPFVIPGANNNISFWLQRRKKEVVAIREHNITPSSDISGEWTTYTSQTNTTRQPVRSLHSNMVAPLCKTIWNQYPYFNAYCPGSGSSKAITGCVATAMSQIMKYWGYPAMGAGSNCYDDEGPFYSENYGRLCAAFDTAHYSWSAMPDTVNEANNEIAKVMYDCGVSVDMDYGPASTGGSGAFVLGAYPSAQYSFVYYFGYDGSTINGAYYSNYTETNWIALIKNELNNNRPVEYEGTDPVNGGHTWVCDGYNAINDFHMNWGWSGADDGYYSVASLTPFPDDFSEQDAVLYGIEPPQDALAIAKVTENTAITVYPNPSHGIFNFSLPNGNNSYQVMMYNMLGQQVYSSSINSATGAVNLSTQPKGVYIYRILTESGESISTGRLIIE